MGSIQPASAHSGSQLSDTHKVSIGALPMNLVTIVSRNCAHGELEYSTLSPVLASKAARWLLTVSTAADQVAKWTGSAAWTLPVLPSTLPAATPAAETLRNERRLTEVERDICASPLFECLGDLVLCRTFRHLTAKPASRQLTTCMF